MNSVNVYKTKCITPQKTTLFITTTMEMSNPTKFHPLSQGGPNIVMEQALDYRNSNFDEGRCTFLCHRV